MDYKATLNLPQTDFAMKADLARRAGVTDRQVRKALSGLHGAGLLTIVHRGGLWRGATIYRVHPLAR